MNWDQFVHPLARNGHEGREKSHAGYLAEIVDQITNHNTLANWVRETNDRFSLS